MRGSVRYLEIASIRNVIGCALIGVCKTFSVTRLANFNALACRLSCHCTHAKIIWGYKLRTTIYETNPSELYFEVIVIPTHLDYTLSYVRYAGEFVQCAIPLPLHILEFVVRREQDERAPQKKGF